MMYNKLVALVVVALLANQVFSAGITFVGNVSLNANSRQDWQFRKTTFGVLPLLNAAWFTSVDVQRAAGSLSGDVIVGGINGGSIGVYPSAYLGYATANISGSFNGDNAFNFDATAAASFIAGAYISVVEKDTAGNVAATLNLNEIFLWEITDFSVNGQLKYGTFQGTSQTTQGKYQISFTVLISDITGVVSLAGAVITPKVLETIVQINNWPYKAATNTLTLKMVAATGSGSLEKDLFVSGSGANQVFFQVNSTAVVNGGLSGVTITSETTAVGDLGVNKFEAMLSAKFKGAAQAKAFYVTFPAGASTITYDPTMGSGEPISQQQNDNSSAPTLLARMTEALVFCLVFVLFW